MRLWNWFRSDDASAKDVQVVENGHYRTRIVVTRASDSFESDDDLHVGSNFDEHSLGENTKRLRHMRTTLLYTGISGGLILIVVIILSVGFGKDLFGKAPNGPDVYNYREFSGGEERAERIYEYLISVAVHGAAGFNDPISPESQALAWMQYDDPLILDPNATEIQYRIDQRFALLTLWFQSDYEWFGQTNWLTGHECTWEGVTCEIVDLDPNRSLSEAPKHVTRNMHAADELHSHIVRELNLPRNNLQGTLPPNLHLLKNLKSLNLSGNRISGPIPTTLSSMIWLEELYLRDNFLSQELSLDFSRMSNLVDVNLSNNQFEGTIPASLYTVPSISRIHLANNKFTGTIADDIGSLVNLYAFSAGGNQLQGSISSLSRIENLTALLLADNDLTGEVNLAGMRNLRELVLENNNFVGPLPDLSDSPDIQVLRFGGNFFDNLFFPMNYLEMTNMVNLGLNNLYLTGGIPDGIGTFTNLEVLNLEGNSLNGPIPFPLLEVTTLRELTLHNNELSGMIPFEISYLINLEKLTLSSNQFESNIPVAIRRLTSLKTLTLASNNFGGRILTSVESLSDLEVLDLAGNAFTGVIPDSFWTLLTSLRTLSLADNYFAGQISESVGNLQQLQVLNFGSNAFRGRIPESIVSLTNLEVLDLSFNFFGGPIPSNVGNLLNLRELLLSTNHDASSVSFGLDGTIPASIAKMQNLEKLEINRNRISGFLPSAHKYLKSIKVYDVSENEELGGTIPKDFTNMTRLNGLNIFGTNIDGIVPPDFCERDVAILVDCEGGTRMTCSCCLCVEND